MIIFVSIRFQELHARLRARVSVRKHTRDYINSECFCLSVSVVGLSKCESTYTRTYVHVRSIQIKSNLVLVYEGLRET